MDEVKVLSPATVSNVVVGFDCLGFSLEEPHDEMTVRKIDEQVIRIRHLDDFGLPNEPSKNVAGVALQTLIDAVDIDVGFEVEITKNIKPGSGIGSSSASSCGAVVAANRLLGDRFSKSELLEFAMSGEMLASGARHADNAAPCIYGGFTLVRSTEPLDIVEIEFPELYATVVHPLIEIKTSEARAILPQEVSLKSAIRNWSNLGAFVAALGKNNYDLIARSMDDQIIEPVRKSLIPKFDEVKSASLAAGALGGGISGSGPSIFMLSKDEQTAGAVKLVMKDIFSTTDIDFNLYVSGINPKGVRILENQR